MLGGKEEIIMESNKSQNNYPAFLRLVEFSPNAIFIYSDYVINYVNDKALEFCEHSSREEIIGKNIRDVLRIHEDYNEIINERIKILEGGETSLPYLEQKFFKASGEILHAEVAASSFLVDGKLHYMLIAKDITQRKLLEEEVKSSYEAYYQLINFLPDAVVLSKKGVLTFANQQGLNLLGADRVEDLRGLKIVDFSHPDYRAGVAHRMDRLINHREAVPLTEHKIINLKGKEIDIEVKTMVLTLHGEEAGVSVLHDITERKRAENEVRKSKDLYKNLVKLLPEGVFVTVNGRFNFINESGVALLGENSYEKVLGRSLVDFIPPEDFNKVNDIKKHINNENEGPHFTEHRIIQESGKIVNVESASTLVEVDGRPAALTVAKDITERTIYERFLKESEERYRKLIDLLPDGIFITSRGIITWCNQNLARLLGFQDTSELIGKSPLDFLPDFIKQPVLRQIDEMLKSNGTSKSLKHKLYRRDGSSVTVESISFCFYENNNKLVLTVFRDLSERLKIEEFRKKSEESRRLLEEVKHYDKIKTEFFGNMSHEIRTPLNVILSSQQLISSYLNKDVACCSNERLINKHLSVMKHNCNRLLRLFNNIIDITRIDAGFMELNLKNYNIINVVEETVLSVSGYIESKGISLTFDTELEELIMAVDGEKLERIILNLLSNATKFTDPGGSIVVNIRQRDTEIIISVRDTGIGMPQEKQGVIFERFIQIDKSFTRNHEGSGIGLSIVKSLVELHEGSIRVNSSPGLGSEFIVSLPIRVLEGTETAADIDTFFNSEGGTIEFSDVYTE